jgi:hypothetical protein
MQKASIGGPRQGDVLGDHLADDGVQEDHDPQGDDEGGRMHRVLMQAKKFERALKEVGDGRLAERAQADAADGDAQLRPGDHQRDLVHRLERPRRRAGSARLGLDHGTS